MRQNAKPSSSEFSMPRSDNNFVCPYMPGNLRISPEACAKRYLLSHDPASWNTNGHKPKLLVDWKPHSLYYCYSCAIGQRNATTLPKNSECLVQGCSNRAQCRGFCNLHYAAWRDGRLEGFGPWYPAEGPAPGPQPKINTKEKKVTEQKKKKICERCGELKPLDEFQRHQYAKNADGRIDICKACMREASVNAERKDKAKDSLKIDFSEYLDVLEALLDVAPKHARSPEGQAIIYIAKGLMAEGNYKITGVKV